MPISIIINSTRIVLGLFWECNGCCIWGCVGACINHIEWHEARSGICVLQNCITQPMVASSAKLDVWQTVRNSEILYASHESPSSLRTYDGPSFETLETILLLGRKSILSMYYSWSGIVGQAGDFVCVHRSSSHGIQPIKFTVDIFVLCWFCEVRCASSIMQKLLCHGMLCYNDWKTPSRKFRRCSLFLFI